MSAEVIISDMNKRIDGCKQVNNLQVYSKIFQFIHRKLNKDKKGKIHGNSLL